MTKPKRTPEDTVENSLITGLVLLPLALYVLCAVVADKLWRIPSH